MENNTLKQILIIGLITVTAVIVNAADEKELISILKSNASITQKCDACRQLRIYGTAQSVPALAALLQTERIGHAARYALEGMPYPQAGRALRDAMIKTSGPVKAGLIDSLGWRRDIESTPMLIPLLKDADPVVAAASASALGRIATPDAQGALLKSQNNYTQVRDAVLQALLNCAELHLANNNTSQAIRLYGALYKQDHNSSVRIAAWRGLALSDTNQRTDLVISALNGKDEGLKSAAIKLVRETRDEKLVKSCMKQLTSLSLNAQILLIDVLASNGNNTAMPDILKAHNSPEKAVRIAAVKAIGTLGDESSVKFLADQAAQTSGDEQLAARESLKILRGKDVNQKIIQCIKDSDTATQIELIGSLNDRRATETASFLLQSAQSDNKEIRIASFRSLHDLASAEHIDPMVQMLLKSPSDEKPQIDKAITATAIRCKARQKASEIISAGITKADNASRISMISILGQLGSSNALPALEQALNSKKDPVKYAAIKALSIWPNGQPKDKLLRIAESSDNNTHKVLALRGYIDLIGRDSSSQDDKIKMYKQAMQIARGTGEKRRVLSGIAQLRTLSALEMSESYLADKNLKDEASVAVTTICKSIYKENKKAAKNALTKVIEAKAPQFVIKQAREILEEIESIRNYLTDWQVAGPYLQDGKNYAALHDIPFGPELSGVTVDWKHIPVKQLDNHPAYVDLLEFLNGGEQRVAYIKTEIQSADKAETQLEIFSDDGVKAWLNGQLIHNNNIARPIMPDPDIVKVSLNKGQNSLLLKITQNNMPWGAIVRLKEPVIVEPSVGRNFRIHTINADSKFEAGCFSDINGDGRLDIFSGGFWYEAPDWKKHFVRQVREEGGYHYDFADIPVDVDKDGDIDIVSAAWHNKKVFWVRNPGSKPGEFEVFDIDTPGNMETAFEVDINSDGQLDILPNIMNQAAWYEYKPDKTSPTGVKWIKHQLPDAAKGHGIGAGDVDGDGKCDVIGHSGWARQSKDSADKWTWHGDFELGSASVPVLVHDVDSDGLNDIIYGMGHNYGIFWLKQGKDPDGSRTWQKLLIDDKWSQPHFLLLADIDNDGRTDLLTGKRVHAHNGHDPGGNESPCVYYYTFSDGSWHKNVISQGNNVGFGIYTHVADIDKDGDLDILCPGKSGLYLAENLIR